MTKYEQTTTIRELTIDEIGAVAGGTNALAQLGQAVAGAVRSVGTDGLSTLGQDPSCSMKTKVMNQLGHSCW